MTFFLALFLTFVTSVPSSLILDGAVLSALWAIQIQDAGTARAELSSSQVYYTEELNFKRDLMLHLASSPFPWKRKSICGTPSQASAP